MSPYYGIVSQMPVFGSRMHPFELEMTRKSELCIHNKLIIFYAVLAVPVVVVVDNVVADVIYDAIAATTTTTRTTRTA